MHDNFQIAIDKKFWESSTKAVSDSSFSKIIITLPPQAVKAIS
jgi:hypothetical protein